MRADSPVPGPGPLRAPQQKAPFVPPPLPDDGTPIVHPAAPSGSASPSGAGSVTDGPRHRRPWGALRLTALSVLGTVLPGAGLVAARRRWGWAVLIPVVLAAGALAYAVAAGRALPWARRYAFQPRAVLTASIAVGVIAVLWCAVVVASHLALRRHGRVVGRRALSVVLVSALVAAVGVPSATAVRYALTSRSLLLDVFGTAAGSRAGLAAPHAGASDPWAGVPRVNVLLVGADSSQGHEGTRPDTVIVASTDTKTGDTVLFGLPRQLEEIPFPPGSPAARLWPSACRANGQGGCLLNAAYLFGVQHPELFPGAADPGLQATREAASGITGLKMDYEVMINLDGFEHLVDAMGGITLTVDRPYPIGGGHRLNSRGQEVGSYPITGYVPAGRDEHLNGYQAEWYVRSRADSDNGDRMNRQRCFLNAAARQYGVGRLARAFPALAAAAEKDLVTDISASELDAFVVLGQRVKKGTLRTLSFDVPLVDTAHPDYSRIHALVRQAIQPPERTGSTAAPTTATPAAPTTPAPTTPTPTPTPTTPTPTTPTPTAPAPGAPGSGVAVDADSVCSS